VQNVRNSGILDLFRNGKTRELGPRAVDHRDAGPPWTGLRRRPEELTGALPKGALVHESSPRPLEKNEELIKVRSRASPEVEEQRGGRATAVKVRRRRCSVRALLRRGERGKEAGRGAVKLRGGAHLL
jgi:hypothetical protein